MLMIESLAGVILTALATYMATISINMKAPDGFWTGTGVFPLIVTAIIAICSAIWSVASISSLVKKGIQNDIETLIAPIRNSESRKRALRLVGILSMSLLYILVLMPWLHFTIATLAFLIATCLLFTKAKWYVSILTSVIVTYSIYAAFRYVLMLPMP